MAVLFFISGLGYGSYDVTGNTLINMVHGKSVDPWMQALHFGFGLGAFLSPIMVAHLGYQATFMTLGIVSLTLLYPLLVIAPPGKPE